MNPENTVFDAKRLIGRKFTDAAVQSDMKHWPFKVISGAAGKPMIQVQYKDETKQFAAEEISSMVLIKMKEIAEAYLGETVNNAGTCLLTKWFFKLLLTLYLFSHYCPCLLQRFSKTSYQGCWCHLWFECPSYRKFNSNLSVITIYLVTNFFTMLY